MELELGDAKALISVPEKDKAEVVHDSSPLYFFFTSMPIELFCNLVTPLHCIKSIDQVQY